MARMPDVKLSEHCQRSPEPIVRKDRLDSSGFCAIAAMAQQEWGYCIREFPEKTIQTKGRPGIVRQQIGPRTAYELPNRYRINRLAL